MHISVKKLETLGATTKILDWKGAREILGQITSELDFSGHSADHLLDFLNKVYSEPKCRELELGQAMRLALVRGDESALQSHAGGTKVH